ncbi:MAG: hypothetical protein ACT4P5_16510 [Armatimonadota bacterium]
MWDFTIRERAEQHWQEAHAAAAEQRLIKLLAAERPASLLARLRDRITRSAAFRQSRPAPAPVAARKI